MEESVLYDLIEFRRLLDYREELEKDENDCFNQRVKKSREKLEETLTKEQLKLVEKHINDISWREENINYNLSVRLLNYGVKIGMELQKAFDNFKE